MAAGPGLGPTEPRVLSAWGWPSRGRAFPPPVCGLPDSWGSERRRGRGSDPPTKSSGSVISSGPAGPGDMRPWGASGAGSMMGFHGNTTQRMPGPLAQHELSPCSGSGPEPGLTSIPVTTATTKQPRLLLPLAQAPARCSSQHFADPLSSLQTLWIPGSHPPLSLLRAVA